MINITLNKVTEWPPIPTITLKTVNVSWLILTSVFVPNVQNLQLPKWQQVMYFMLLQQCSLIETVDLILGVTSCDLRVAVDSPCFKQLVKHQNSWWTQVLYAT